MVHITVVVQGLPLVACRIINLENPNVFEPTWSHCKKLKKVFVSHVNLVHELCNKTFQNVKNVNNSCYYCYSVINKSETGNCVLNNLHYYSKTTHKSGFFLHLYSLRLHFF